MKVEIDIPIEELDYESDYDDRDEGNHVDVLIEMITDKAASLLVQQIDYDYRISLEKSLENKINNIEKCLETRITERVSKDSLKRKEGFRSSNPERGSERNPSSWRPGLWKEPYSEMHRRRLEATSAQVGYRQDIRRVCWPEREQHP